MTALVVRDLTVVLGGRVVVAGVDVDVDAGDVVVVTGASGAGKSVLWKAIAGLVPRTRGVVDVARPPLVFVHQDPALLDDRDVHENLTFPARERGLKDAAARALHMAARLGVVDVLTRMPAQLSPSQARRVSLARALALQPSVLVVDEPTTGLDVVAAADVDDALATVVAGVAGVAGDVDVDGAPACALVVITHHPRTRARLARLPRARALVVAQGQLLPEAA